MKKLKAIFDAGRPAFKKGGRFAKFAPLFDATETFFFFPGIVTRSDTHIRDGLDLKRFMGLVLLALMPPFLFGIYNTGLQSHLVSGQSLEFFSVATTGARIVLPIVIVSYAVGFFWETLFAAVRGHDISEGLLVTGLLFPMTLPPTIPLWQVAAGISFGVVIGKEVFGGTGRNFLNPALTARAFVFFAYPASMSGDSVWTAVTGAGQAMADGISAATPLALAALADATQSAGNLLTGMGYDGQTLLLGTYPGSIGSTSALMCLVGALLLITTGIASYRIICGGILGLAAAAAPAWLLALPAGGTAPFQALSPAHHLIVGGFALGIVYMATDPVSGPGMNASRWIYGFAIGVLTYLIRVFNPAYPEGIMLAILLMNVFAPLLDYFTVKARLKKRVPNV